MKTAKQWDNEGRSCSIICREKWIEEIQNDAVKSTFAKVRPFVELLKQFVDDGYIILESDEERPFADLVFKVRHPK